MNKYTNNLNGFIWMRFEWDRNGLGRYPSSQTGTGVVVVAGVVVVGASVETLKSGSVTLGMFHENWAAEKDLLHTNGSWFGSTSADGNCGRAPAVHAMICGVVMQKPLGSPSAGCTAACAVGVLLKKCASPRTTNGPRASCGGWSGEGESTASRNPGFQLAAVKQMRRPTMNDEVSSGKDPVLLRLRSPEDPVSYTHLTLPTIA